MTKEEHCLHFTRRRAREQTIVSASPPQLPWPCNLSRARKYAYFLTRETHLRDDYISREPRSAAVFRPINLYPSARCERRRVRAIEPGSTSRAAGIYGLARFKRLIPRVFLPSAAITHRNSDETPFTSRILMAKPSLRCTERVHYQQPPR